MKKLFALSLAILMVLSLLVACGKDSPPATSDTETPATPSDNGEKSAQSEEEDSQPEEEDSQPVITIFHTKGGFEPPPPDDPIKKKIEEDSGVKFELVSPPSANYTEQMHLMLASDEHTDMVWFQLPTGPFEYADMLLDLTPYFDQMPHVLNYEFMSDKAMKFYNVDGKQIAIPKTTSTKRYNLIIRQDWLEKLGLKVPTTLDELHDVAVAFTRQDPDGNGKDDTYGISGLGLDSFDYILGAFGVILGETSWNAPDTLCNIYFKEVDGKLVPMVTLPEMKEALTLLNKWYSEGIIDPEYASHSRAIWEEKFEQSRFGITTHWWTWESNRENNMIQTTPDVKIARIAPPVGPTGLSGLRAVNEVVGGVAILADSKYPEECVKLIDYLHTEEGMMTSYTGVEGIHWYKDESGKYLTTEQFNKDNKWIQWYFIFENEWPLHKVETHLVQSRRDALKWNVIRDEADLIVTEAKLKYLADLQAFVAETFNNMITGKTPIDTFDSFVEEFMARGGQEWTDEVNAKRK